MSLRHPPEDQFAGTIFDETPEAVQTSDGIGLEIPARESDCTGTQPSVYAFQIDRTDVCDEDTPDVNPLPTQRHRTVP